MSDSSATHDHASERRALATQLVLFHNDYKRWAQALVGRGGLGVSASVEQIWFLYLVRTEGLAPSALARRLMVSPTVITGMVDRLESRGWMRREAHPHDRRRIQLVITDEGRALSEHAENVFLDRIAQSFDELDADDLRLLQRSLDILEVCVGRLDLEEAGS